MFEERTRRSPSGRVAPRCTRTSARRPRRLAVRESGASAAFVFPLPGTASTSSMSSTTAVDSDHNVDQLVESTARDASTERHELLGHATTSTTSLRYSPQGTSDHPICASRCGRAPCIRLGRRGPILVQRTSSATLQWHGRKCRSHCRCSRAKGSGFASRRACEGVDSRRPACPARLERAWAQYHGRGSDPD